MQPEWAARFWARVDKNGPISELGTPCWIWTGPQAGKGYGYPCFNGKHEYAHRLAWELAYGPIGNGLTIDHRCHVPLCVNAEHLRCVTQKQNIENQRNGIRQSANGVRGVTRGRWGVGFTAQLKHEGKCIYLGTYATLEEAEQAAVNGRARLFTHSDGR